MTEKPTIEASVAVIEKDGKILISKRLKKSPLGSCWEFPGGKLESGETPEECAVREVQEEVGIVVQPQKILDSLWYDYPHGQVHLHFVQCTWVSGEPQALECEAVQWIEAHEFSSYDFPPADIGVIASLMKI
jgi:mutator protein MutT